MTLRLVCLRMTRDAQQNGIIGKDEEAMPVGDKAVSDSWIESKWVCPHILGGIPPRVVMQCFMTRDGPRFVAIEGLV